MRDVANNVSFFTGFYAIFNLFLFVISISSDIISLISISIIPQLFSDFSLFCLLSKQRRADILSCRENNLHLKDGRIRRFRLNTLEIS